MISLINSLCTMSCADFLLYLMVPVSSAGISIWPSYVQNNLYRNQWKCEWGQQHLQYAIRRDNDYLDYLDYLRLPSGFSDNDALVGPGNVDVREFMSIFCT